MAKSNNSPLAAAVGAAVLASAALSPLANAANPFEANQLNQGYNLAANYAIGDKAEGEGKCGEGKCGGEKTDTEGKCGEGKCGGEKTESEGKCGEGKCGG
ncbi:hypothetical protein [Halioxenophilus aromaticivorans]|uniref:Low-complexity protein n=1 Tax=Halioxenophilus aromaticivorans TaxID=1306992 RepID=A0AAV3TZP3_9ALTE